MFIAACTIIVEYAFSEALIEMLDKEIKGKSTKPKEKCIQFHNIHVP